MSGETLSVNKARDIAAGLEMRMRYLLNAAEVPVIVITDCMNLVNNVYATNPQCKEEELTTDLYAIRESARPECRYDKQGYNGVTCDLWHIPTKLQMADPLTKNNALSIDFFDKYFETGLLDFTGATTPRNPNYPHPQDRNCLLYTSPSPRD